jgi:hypothetical protein
MALVARSRRVNCSGQWLRLLLVWTLVSGLPAGSWATVALTEYEVKAGFLYYVGCFVAWPATTVQASTPIFIIGMFGTNPFGGPLNDVMGGKTIRECPVGMIAFRLVDRKAHFDISMDATKVAGLNLSAQLLQLAKVIHSSQRVQE